MADVTTPATTLLDAINISLSCLGETPVSSPANTSTNVVLAKQIIEEVSRDIQSKGWWFNTSGTAISILSTTDGTDTDGNISFNASIPEEARRYISIRSARVLQSRFVGSEELQKFSFQEEQVSLAILTQAHVKNGGNSTSFTAFPADLKNLGIEEVLFLQQSAEEKLYTLKLTTELKQSELTDAQKSNVQTDTVLKSQQALTEVEETSKRAAEKLLIDAQELKTDAEAALIASQTTTDASQRALIDAQELKTDAETTLTTKQGLLTDAQELLTDAQALDVAADTALKTSQKTQLDAQTAIEATAEKDFYDGVVAGTQATYRDYAAEMRMMGVQESMFQQTPAYKKVELLKDAEKLRTSTATYFYDLEDELLPSINRVLRLIGESPVSNTNENALASETIRLYADTNKELQGRGWYFNTKEYTTEEPDETNGSITIPSTFLDIHPVDPNSPKLSLYPYVNGSQRLYNEDDWTTVFTKAVKLNIIYSQSLQQVPQKYLEYLEVRTAILLTELYPQSGVDIQRLPKMEAELRAYFKDRENDDANYNVFDNYDTASIMGVNRNYSIL
jgi:hypothetical protein